MTKIIANLHFIVILFILSGVFSNYSTHQEALQNVLADLTAQQDTLTKKKAEYRSIENYNRDIEKVKADLELARGAIERMQKQLPSEVSNTENLEILSGIASALNIKSISLAPGEEQNRGFYIAKEYSFRATGTFLQFVIFFERLAKEQRLFNVNMLKLSTGGKKQKGRFQVVDAEVSIEAYKYNPSHKETIGVDPAEQEKNQDVPVKKRRRNSKAVGGE